jgi:hypothetical protein
MRPNVTLTATDHAAPLGAAVFNCLAHWKWLGYNAWVALSAFLYRNTPHSIAQPAQLSKANPTVAAILRQTRPAIRQLIRFALDELLLNPLIVALRH